MASKNLLVRGGADFSSLKKEMDKTQKNLATFQKNVGKAMKSIGAILGTIAVGSLIKSSTQAAMAVESAMDNINRNMGNSAGAFQKWVETQSGSFAMAKKDAYSYGSVFSNLLGSFSASTQETAQNTQKLMEAAAVIASKTGRTYEDTADRIRSGLLGSTEAIEDLGIYTNISMIESTEAFKKFANGKSWAQLDFQIQQQIRLAAILEQTYARYGDTLADTTATRQAQFVASLNNIKLSLGQAFLPIYNAVLPALTTMANALGRVVSIISQFTTALFGTPKASNAQTQAIKAQSAAVGGLGDSAASAGKAAKKAGKEAKGALAGFDEINRLNKADTSSAGGGGGGIGAGAGIGDLGTIDMGGGFADSAVAVSEKVQDMADKIKGAVKGVADFISSNKTIIISAVGGIIGAFAGFAIISNWTTIVAGFKGVLAALSGVFAGISLPILAAAGAIGLVVGNIIYLWQTNEDFRNSVIEVWNSIKTFLTTIVKDTWEIIKGIWDKYGGTLIANLKGFMKSIQDLVLKIWEGVIKPIVDDALKTLTWLWDKHIKGLVQTFGEVVMKLINGALELWNNFFAPVIGWLVDKLAPIFTSVISYAADVFGTKIALIVDIAKGLLKALGGIIDFIVGVFTGNWKKAWEGLKTIFKGVFDSLVGIVKYPLNLIIDAINAVIRGVNKFKINIPSWAAKIADLAGFKGGSIGFNIPTIPKLAQGGYVGANNPMLAMIGDNRMEGEIVAPESKIYEQTFKAVSDALRGNSGTPIDLTINFGSSTVFHEIINGINKAQRQSGKTLITV